MSLKTVKINFNSHAQFVCQFCERARRSNPRLHLFRRLPSTGRRGVKEESAARYLGGRGPAPGGPARTQPPQPRSRELPPK